MLFLSLFPSSSFFLFLFYSQRNALSVYPVARLFFVLFIVFVNKFLQVGFRISIIICCCQRETTMMLVSSVYFPLWDSPQNQGPHLSIIIWRIFSIPCLPAEKVASQPASEAGTNWKDWSACTISACRFRQSYRRNLIFCALLVVCRCRCCCCCCCSSTICELYPIQYYFIHYWACKQNIAFELDTDLWVDRAGNCCRYCYSTTTLA